MIDDRQEMDAPEMQQTVNGHSAYEAEAVSAESEPPYVPVDDPEPAAPLMSLADMPDQRAAFDAPGAIARLVAGLVIEGVSELNGILQAWEADNPPGQRVARLMDEMSSAERIRYASLGLTVEATQRTRSVLDRLGQRALKTGERWQRVIRPIADNPIMRPARQRYEDLVARGEETVQRWIETGRFEEAHGRAMARSTTSEIIDRVVGHLEYNETTQGLIRAQADAYLAFLVENPEPVRELINNEVGAFLGELEGDPEQLDGLVQEVADRYINYIRANPALIQALIEEQADVYLDHLQENPEHVQALIQDQSIGMAGEMMDEVRVRTVTVDTLMERLARGVLRRQPVSTSAPPQVRELADYKPIDEPVSRASAHNGENVT